MGIWFRRVGNTQYRVLVTSGCLLSRKNDEPSKSVAFVQKLRYIHTRKDQGGDHMKINFECFQLQKWTLPTVRVETADGENGVICLVFMFPSWVMVLNLPKKVHLLQFCADLSKKSKSIKAICIYAFESSC